MSRFKTWLAAALLSVSAMSHAQSPRFILCIDQTWYPFTYLMSYRAGGVFVDMVEEAGDRLGLKVRVRPLDWTRCMEHVREGTIDAVLGISYRNAAERNQFLHYPMNGNEADTRYSLSNLEDAVVTLHSQNYEYDGNPYSLPQPVRIPNGYALVDALRGLDIEVDDSAQGDQANLIKLSAERDGSVIMLRQLAEVLADREFFDSQLHISEQAYTSVDFYLAFSVEAGLSPQLRQAVWDAVRDIREDEVLMRSYYEEHTP